jgi:ribosome-associated protein
MGRRAYALRRGGGAIIRRMRDFSIRDDMIRLSQLLKAAGLAGSGAEAKELVVAGEVRVNGEVETRRGRQLRRGDVVVLGEESIRVA